MVMMGVLSHMGLVEKSCLSFEMVMAVKKDDLVKLVLRAGFSDELCQFKTLVESLVDAGESMVDSDDLGQTLVHWAMAEDSKCGEKLLTFILDKGADPDSENYYGKRPKDMAVRNDKIKLALLLMKYKVQF